MERTFRAHVGPLLLVQLALVVTLSWSAISALTEGYQWDESVINLGITNVLIPAAMMTVAVGSKRHSLAWSVYWTWVFVFLGLAPAYQIAIDTFPWGAHFASSTVREAQATILIGNACALIAYGVSRSRGRVRESQATATNSFGDGHRLASSIERACLAHSAIALVFFALMRGALASGRQAFQQALLRHAGIPGFGTVYFAATAGAIILPPIAIVLFKHGIEIRPAILAMSVGASLVVTNPLIGSRFLTGSCLIAICAASVSPQVRRWLPIAITLAFVTIFPSLDLLRGNGTGSSHVTLSTPSQALLDFDYDSFEMLTRAVSLHGQFSPSLVSRGDLVVAPFLRWVPFASRSVQGHATGRVVATETGMGFTNVSMPLWGEAQLLGGTFLLVLTFLAAGWLLGRSADQRTLFGRLIELPMAALLFIVLRGSLYEVLGYLLLAIGLAWHFGKQAKSVDPVRPAVALRQKPVTPRGTA